MRFSPSTLGWYPEHTDYDQLPDDIVEVSEESYASLRGLQIEVGPDGMPRAYTPSTPSFEERKAALLAAVDAHLNAAAYAKGYDNIMSASLRAALPNSPFHADGVAFGTWMDQVYAKCYEVLAEVQAGHIEEPTLEQLIGMLPVLQLPE